MNRTKIEYLTHTWNPIAMRCTPVGAGCANCWHLRMANRLAGNQAFPPEVRDAYAGEGPPVLIKHRLNEPLRHKEPAVIGVQFMGDLFHKDVPFDFITEVFDVMCDARSQHHIFQILTKRLQRFSPWLNWVGEFWPGDSPFSIDWEVCGYAPNVHLGTSIENQETADKRTPVLLQIPAAVHFVSMEPMLGPVDLTNIRVGSMEILNALTGVSRTPHSEPPRYAPLSWVICGGETGPGARPMHPDWVRGIRDQCQAASTPFFFKSWGEWVQLSQLSSDVRRYYCLSETDDQGLLRPDLETLLFPDGKIVKRVGKRAAGRQLDGREWNEMLEMRK